MDRRLGTGVVKGEERVWGEPGTLHWDPVNSREVTARRWWGEAGEGTCSRKGFPGLPLCAPAMKKRGHTSTPAVSGQGWPAPAHRHPSRQGCRSHRAGKGREYKSDHCPYASWGPGHVTDPSVLSPVLQTRFPPFLSPLNAD